MSDAHPKPDKQNVVPAYLRSAPRYGRIIGTGVCIGVVAGLVLGLALPNESNAGRGAVTLLTVLGLAILGGTVAGLFAVSAEGTAQHAKPTPAPEESD